MQGILGSDASNATNLTKEEFVKKVDTFVRDCGPLERFFKGKETYIQDIALKLTELSNDQSTDLGSKDLLPKTVKVSLHKQVIYCGKSPKTVSLRIVVSQYLTYYFMQMIALPCIVKIAGSIKRILYCVSRKSALEFCLKGRELRFDLSTRLSMTLLICRLSKSPRSCLKPRGCRMAIPQSGLI